MSKVILAQRYANALGDSLQTPEELETALAELQTFTGAFESNHDLRTAITNPSIPATTRLAVFDEVLQTEQSSPAKRTLRVLFDRDRLALVTEVAKAFSATCDLRMNRVAGTLTTTRALSEDKRAAIESSISQFAGKDVQLETQTDEAILGGVVVRIGDTIIDGSLRTRLTQLKQALHPSSQVTPCLSTTPTLEISVVCTKNGPLRAR